MIEEGVLTQAPDSPEVGRAGPPIASLYGDPLQATGVAAYIQLFATLFPDLFEQGAPRGDRSPRECHEPHWLSMLRRDAIQRFAQLGFPTTKDEDWHFTNVAPIASRAFDHVDAPAVRRVDVPSSVSAAQIAPFLFGEEWQTLVFVNGSLVPNLSRYDSGDATYTLGSLADAIATGHPAVERHLAELATFQANAFTALNTAFMQDGAFIALQPSAVVDRPIHLLFIVDANAEGKLIAPRTLILADHHADVTVVESYVSLSGTTYLTNAVTEVSLAPGARVRHYKIQRESEAAYHVGSSYAYQQSDSQYESFSFATGADLSRTNISTVLAGPGAHATVNGLYMVDGTQTVDHQTRIEHAQENCTSHEVYKGILDGDSHGVFNGKVYVRPEAQKTDGKQSNNNLLLSDRARIDTKPQLEIFADDVKCTHGATVGRLDETALFYLESRGIGEETARRLLTYAFAADVLEELTVEAVRDRLELLAFQRFGIDTSRDAPTLVS